MAILVVGGAGYIGSHAARALRRSGYEAVIYDNLSTGFRRLAQGFELVEGDIADTARLRPVLGRVNAVMHFAAHAYVGESVENPRKYFRNNVLGALSLLNSALDAGIRRFVFSSSCAVYGVPERIPITESTPREPVNPYGASKLFFENALEAYGRAYGVHSVSLRYFNAAGADEGAEIGEMHEPETHVIPLALAASAANGPELQVFGSDYPTPDGTCVRDYIHVSDLADAHVRALQYLERNKDEQGGDSLAINLGTGRGHSVLEIIQAAENATGRKLRRKMGPRRAGDPPVLVADPTKARRVLGWAAQRNLADSMSSAWTWMQKTGQRHAA
ncbi:MAG TPA: UDP-glucose 4-epimerase GalE [Terriglobales bacterium]|nr:UDP-glucose 4-epimerase GalE [Terriglobales bacterium]